MTKVDAIQRSGGAGRWKGVPHGLGAPGPLLWHPPDSLKSTTLERRRRCSDRFSHTVTDDKPTRRAWMAAISPTGPPPTTSTSCDDDAPAALAPRHASRAHSKRIRSREGDTPDKACADRDASPNSAAMRGRSLASHLRSFSLKTSESAVQPCDGICFLADKSHPSQYLPRCTVNTSRRCSSIETLAVNRGAIARRSRQKQPLLIVLLCGHSHGSTPARQFQHRGHQHCKVLAWTT